MDLAPILLAIAILLVVAMAMFWVVASQGDDE